MVAKFDKALVSEFYKTRQAYDPTNHRTLDAWQAMVDKVNNTKGCSVLMTQPGSIKKAMLVHRGMILNSSGEEVADASTSLVKTVDPEGVKVTDETAEPPDPEEFDPLADEMAKEDSLKGRARLKKSEDL